MRATKNRMGGGYLKSDQQIRKSDKYEWTEKTNGFVLHRSK
jgi:hypothetical protein